MNILLLICLSFFIAALANAQERDLTAKLDEYLQASYDQGVFSGTVLVAQQGKILYKTGFGLADYERNVPNGGNTKYRWGSLTKAFTAHLILQLQEQGKLNVQDKLSQHVPGFPNGDRTTLHQLLTHTSGLSNYTDFEDFPQVNDHPTTVQNFLNYFKERPLKFEPGQKFSYCNSGYILLGHIIEQKTGMTYAKALQKYILKPLKMTNSGLEVTGKPVDRLAKGYNYNGARRKPSQLIDLSWFWAAGGMYGTPEDLLKWERSLYTNQLLSEESMNKFFQAEKSNYAYGWEVDSAYAQPRIGGSGAINGFRANLTRFPEQELAIIVLSNHESPTINSFIKREVAAIALGQKYEVPVVRKMASLSSEKIQAVVGTYQVAPKMLISVLLEEGQLYVQPTGQERIEIFAESETDFFMKSAPVQFSFEKDSAGQAVKLVMKQGPKSMAGQRVMQEEPKASK
ncbi:MAG: serine hydrolase [Rufibacter sp.]